MTDPATVEQLLVRLAPSGAGVAVCHVEAALLEQLTADERVLVRSARPPRRAEFAAGRVCAHRALAAIGADTPYIGRGQRQQPVWPVGVTGSITHTTGLAAAVAVTATPSVTALGIDVELTDAFEEELWSHTLTPSERAVVEASSDPAAVAATTFSSKEAAFKAFYPLLGVEIDFLEAHSFLDTSTALEVGAGTVEIPSVGRSASILHGRVGPLVVSVAIVSTARDQPAAVSGQRVDHERGNR